jgi:hypothetical protein
MPALARPLAALALAACLGSPVFAAPCLTADSLASGILFKRQDGRTGLAKAVPTGVRIDYEISKSSYRVDQRATRLGIYELKTEWEPSDEMIVGSGTLETTRKFETKGPVPEPGGSYRVTVREEWYQADGTEKGYDKGRTTVTMQYSFLEAREVKLSGCTYTAIPVEATTKEDGAVIRRQRWVYFPDLGFGLETVRDGAQNGLVAMTPG